MNTLLVLSQALSLRRGLFRWWTLKLKFYYFPPESAFALEKKALVSSCMERVGVYSRWAPVWCSVWNGWCWRWQSSYIVFNSRPICSIWGLTSASHPSKHSASHWFCRANLFSSSSLSICKPYKSWATPPAQPVTTRPSALCSKFHRHPGCFSRWYVALIGLLILGWASRVYSWVFGVSIFVLLWIDIMN